MKKSLVFVLFFFLTGYVFAQNIAYVDIQKVMNQSKKGQEYKKEIESKVKYYQKKLEEIDKKISQIEKQLESPVLSDEAKKKKRKELEELKEKGRNIQQNAEEELSKMKAKAERELVLKIKEITEKYAKEKNLDLVFIGGAIGGVVYHDKTVDITEEILKRLDGEKN
ncbi:periplasmic chaperone for outer membrane proteins Skp [Persephonella hydrogeniphila]|uniref:Periplasmic chaperone for outer membrane proteins Skp n=1 Tax=Persephonella hydrogeniphila TaxID=198703 RepID=A0A285NQ12_9AQUI|nr:OmpH family outer membrane protein [Persephonella hydrogeniphila]SNZ09936.1 periplasmic chaperone for outer membrane proteins Skp [Persephonella hydrogeniphila]